MKVTALLCVATLTVASFAAPVRAADPTPKPAPAADAVKVFAPTDLEALRPAIGQMVAVEGTLVASGESKTKTVRYLNFTKNFKESVGLVFFVSKGGEEFGLDRISSWVGKKVRATGTLAEHNGGLQIAIEKWEQVQEVQ